MRGPHADPPERLLATDATDFERRVLRAALEKKPSAAASARMARVLGVSAVAVGSAAAAKVLAAEVVVSKATTAAGAATVWPWISVSVIGLVVAGAVVGSRASHETPHAAQPAPVVAPAPRAPVPAAPAPTTDEAATPGTTPAATRRSRAAAPVGDLGEEIAFIDGARAAVASGASGRALDVLRGYQSKYPNGSFRPEAMALKIEALINLGRETEARPLAERFLAEHRGTLLSKRVAQIAGVEVR
jgi:hypothetical protein